MPFLDRAGLNNGVPDFDFKVPGVTSISCDTVGLTGFMPPSQGFGYLRMDRPADGLSTNTHSVRKVSLRDPDPLGRGDAVMSAGSAGVACHGALTFQDHL
jgi:hypothetical protein